ncbi:hypothetical protein ACFV1F_33185 [Streptomyces sp. NPDC059590]|uniref:hypothetical protein n=1 Tax=unclassified Streptomyces TaxID=2593676 RepID=UPI00369F8472
MPTRMGGAGAPDDLVAGHRTQVWLATHHHITPHTGGYWYHRAWLFGRCGHAAERAVTDGPVRREGPRVVTPK